jgi:cytochrome b6-f complex iron-sulfur subunit/menaquinol-cytochrome c reductase iron-sulfur subunit
MSQAAGGGEGRRGALKHLAVLGSAALGCAVAAPAAVFLAAPIKAAQGGGKEQWVRTVRLDSLTEGEPKKVSIVADQRDAWTLSRDVELGAVWLVRHGDTVVALSAVCPHLGCAISWAADGGFACPCHDSAFAPDGARLSGPSPRGMDPLPTKIEGDVVVVGFEKFQIGTPGREAIG